MLVHFDHEKEQWVTMRDLVLDAPAEHGAVVEGVEVSTSWVDHYRPGEGCGWLRGWLAWVVKRLGW